MWYANDEIDVTIDGTSVREDMDSSSGTNVRNKNFSRNNWRYYLFEEDAPHNPTKSTIIKDKLNINHQITFEGGSVSDDNKQPSRAALMTDATTVIKLGSGGDTFNTNGGIVQIGDEIIYYDAVTTSGAVPAGEYWLTSCIRGYAHTVELIGGHTSGAVVTDMTGSAIDKKYKIESLRIRGGTIYIWWRMFRYEGLITKMSWTDSKVKHTGGLSRPTRFDLTITFRIGNMP